MTGQLINSLTFFVRPIKSRHNRWLRAGDVKWGFLSVTPHTTTIHIRLLYRLVHRESGVKYPSTSSNIEIGSPTAMVQIILFSKNN
jgi:hypothetical protein